MIDRSQFSVAILDPCPVTRLGIRFILNREPQFTVVVETDDQIEFLKAVEFHCPELAIIDHGSPNQLLLTACSKLKSLVPPVAVLVFTADLSDRTILAYRLCGADSYITKTTPAERFFQVATETVHGGQVWVLGQHPEAHANGRDDQLSELTRREREILSLLLDRRTNQQIATVLRISPNTVKNHVQAVLRKLGLKRRTDLSDGDYSYPYSYTYSYSSDGSELTLFFLPLS